MLGRDGELRDTGCHWDRWGWLSCRRCGFCSVSTWAACSNKMPVTILQGNVFPSENGNLLNSLCANSLFLVEYSTGKPEQVFPWLGARWGWSIFSFALTWAVNNFCELLPTSRGALLALRRLSHLRGLERDGRGERGAEAGPRFLQRPMILQLQARINVKARSY